MKIIGIILTLIGGIGLLLTWTGAINSIVLLAALRLPLAFWAVIGGVGLFLLMLTRRPMN